MYFVEIDLRVLTIKVYSLSNMVTSVSVMSDAKIFDDY